MGRTLGFVVLNPTPGFWSSNPRKWLKLAAMKSPGIVRRAIIECLAPIPRVAKTPERLKLATIVSLGIVRKAI